MMKMIERAGVLLLLCILFCGCGRRDVKEGIPVVDLGKAGTTGDLKLSDLLDNIRVIPLETRPEALLPGHFSAWIGEKYIVTFGEDAIHLFTIDGKYVRKLAQQGRGPEEYLYSMGFCVDNEERYCYLADGSERISVIDLEEGKIVRRISTGENVPYQLWYSDQDSTLVYTPIETADGTNYDICRIALDGTLRYTVENNTSFFARPNSPYLGELNDTIRYSRAFCDTLFLLTDTAVIPYCRFVTERPYSMETGGGRAVDILLEDRDRLILGHAEVSLRKEGDAIYGNVQYLGQYVWDKSDFSLNKVHGFYVDIFDYTATERFPLLVDGKRAYRNINVLRFKELLEGKLDSPLIPGYLKELYEKLGDEDNPVLLVGDIKE